MEIQHDGCAICGPYEAYGHTSKNCPKIPRMSDGSPDYSKIYRDPQLTSNHNKLQIAIEKAGRKTTSNDTAPKPSSVLKETTPETKSASELEPGGNIPEANIITEAKKILYSWFPKNRSPLPPERMGDIVKELLTKPQYVIDNYGQHYPNYSIIDLKNLGRSIQTEAKRRDKEEGLNGYYANLVDFI
ncbi:MAG: hypothetical protein ACD_18C00158G0001 [uncultured bacterium]|nr:MAG: hypothetical protein ACD_18C00158G0001 [uncultured bacterium]